MAFARIQIKGLDKTNKILKQLGKRAPQILGSALFQIGEEIIGKSKEDFVPVDLGHLRSSGFVEEPKVTTRSGVTVELGFGGPAGKGNVGGGKNKISVGYALIVHEDLTAFHKVGENKYLEKPFNKAQRNMDKRIAFLLMEAEPRFR
jgi:hypothetical protein